MVHSTSTKLIKQNQSNQQSIIDAHLVKLYAKLASLKEEKLENLSNDSTRLKSLLEAHYRHVLCSKARHRIEIERIDSRFETETKSTRAHFATKRSELKEHLLDRLRRKRKLVIEEMKSIIDIHSRSFDADPLLVTMQPPHPLQAKAYNFRQRPDMVSGSCTSLDEESSTNNAILSPTPQPQFARKRLVGAFSLFQLPRWTVKDEECEEDLRMISNHRK